MNKLTAAQVRFMSRFDRPAISHAPGSYGEVISIRNGERATADNLISRGLIVEVEKTALGVRQVRKA